MTSSSPLKTKSVEERLERGEEPVLGVTVNEFHAIEYGLTLGATLSASTRLHRALPLLAAPSLIGLWALVERVAGPTIVIPTIAREPHYAGLGFLAGLLLPKLLTK